MKRTCPYCKKRYNPKQKRSFTCGKHVCRSLKYAKTDKFKKQQRIRRLALSQLANNHQREFIKIKLKLKREQHE